MIDSSKVKPSHLRKCACIYIRQSTATQVERNRESTERQYNLVERAIDLGWKREQVVVYDEDLGISGSGCAPRAGFARMTAEVALGHVGIVFGLEVSRLARNNVDWYRLLDLCGITDTLIADADGVYHPSLFNDRLVLGLKGTMSEAELHILRARLNVGIRNKAERGEFRRSLPIGFVWGEKDGEILFNPDEAIQGAIRTAFEQFTECGSVRQVWIWFRMQKIKFPVLLHPKAGFDWCTPTYTALINLFKNPVYAGAYVYGKVKYERFVNEQGQIRIRKRRLPRSEWPVFIVNHHRGYIDWQTFERYQQRITSNIHPQLHQPGGAVRSGAALLQGLASCGHCGRKLRVYYCGKNSTPGYCCMGSTLVDGRDNRCLRVGGCRIDAAVVGSFLATVTPAAIEAVLLAESNRESERDAACSQWRLEVERLRYEAQRAERRYRSVEPENRLVARGLETEWENRLRDLTAAEADLQRKEQIHPRHLSQQEQQSLRDLGTDLQRVWDAPTTTDRDKKELLRALLEDVKVSVCRENAKSNLVLRWRGGLISEIEVDIRKVRIPPIRTDEDTTELVWRLAVHYPDALIASILNKQERRTATGDRFDTRRIGALRRSRNIPRFQSNEAEQIGDLVDSTKAAELLGVTRSTVTRWLADGFIGGEQITPGAPWRIRINEDLLSRFVEHEPEGYVTMQQAMQKLGVSRQAVVQRVKRGDLQAVHIKHGKKNRLRIKVVEEQKSLFSEQ